MKFVSCRCVRTRAPRHTQTLDLNPKILGAHKNQSLKKHCGGVEGVESKSL